MTMSVVTSVKTVSSTKISILVRVSVVWSPGSVANVDYSDGVPDHSIKDFVAITAKKRDANARPLDHGPSAQRRHGDPRDELFDTACYSRSYGRIARPGVIGGYLAKIGDGPLRVFNPHAFLNRAKTASTSSSLASSPASPSSIAANSSGVASYSEPASSASISSAIS